MAKSFKNLLDSMSEERRTGVEDHVQQMLIEMALPEYALQLLSSRKEKIVMPQTGAELVDYWYEMGVIGTRSDIENASAYARKLHSDYEFIT